MHRHAFGDTHYQRQSGIGLFEYGVHGEWRGHEHESGVSASRGDCFASRLEVGDFVHELHPGTVGMHRGDHIGAVFDDALRLERAVTAQSLHKEAAWLFD